MTRSGVTGSGAVRSGVSDGVRSGQGRGQAHYTYIMRQDLVVSSLLGEINPVSHSQRHPR